MKTRTPQHRTCILAVVATLLLSAAALAAQSPTPQQALGLNPMQQFVDYAKPTADEIKACTIRPEKDGTVTAWVVRNPQGESLRRFADTNGDNTVDLWCYYLDGIEVYRDIDSNFNGKADQYRWFFTAGSRWGIDSDENGRIDAWRQISPHEIAEQVVLALRSRDSARFNLLVITPTEVAELGLGKEQSDRVAAAAQAATAGFASLAAEQKVVTPQTRYVDFGSSRPAAIPVGAAGSTKDNLVCDNASALIQVDGKHEQVYLGTLVAIGGTWKLIELPVIGSDKQAPGPFFMSPDAPAENRGPANATAPTEEMQTLMAQLERLDKQADGLAPAEQGANVEQRAELLLKLADATPDVELKAQWYRQLIDMLSVAIQLGTYPKGAERLDELEKRLTESESDEDLLAHVAFQKMWAQYVVGQQQPGADAPKLQAKWLADLQDFVTKHPKSSDSAEALLQLGMYQEFVGKTDDALKWYQQLVSNFPNAPPAAKARGAARRLSSAGKPLPLRGASLQGGEIDVTAYRGKVLLIQSWATWADRCKEDMILLKDFYAKNRNRGFEIVGVNLDESPAPAKQFLNENGFPWKQMHEPGGLDGRLANELGVMTLPLMILIDDRGNVVNDNIHVAELQAEVDKLLKQPAAGPNASRRPTSSPR